MPIWVWVRTYHCLVITMLNNHPYTSYFRVPSGLWHPMAMAPWHGAMALTPTVAPAQVLCSVDSATVEYDMKAGKASLGSDEASRKVQLLGE